MKQIKFRAYDKATKNHWNPPPQGVIEFDIYSVPDFIGNTFDENGEWERRFVVVRSTSHLDYNFTEAFEGDIVKSIWVDKDKYDNGDYNYGLIVYDEKTSSCRLSFGGEVERFAIDLNNEEIIGNIHQHKYLLEKIK